MDDFAYNLSILNLFGNYTKLTEQQKKEYTKFLIINDYSHNRNKKALESKQYDKIYLKLSYKYAKSILKNSKIADSIGHDVLQWIVDNKQAFVDNKVKDTYLIGSANELLDDDYTITPEDIQNKSCNDYQLFRYIKSNKGDDELKLFVQELAQDIQNEKKIIKDRAFLYNLFDSTIKMELDPTLSFLFFRLLCSRLISKREPIEETCLQSFRSVLKQILSYDGPIEGDLHQEIFEFLILYSTKLYNVIANHRYNKVSIPDFDGTIYEIINKLKDLDHDCSDVNIYIKYLYGLYVFRNQSKKDSKTYFSAAAEKNYYKAMYFLSEIVKKDDPEEALELYDKIIKFEIGDESKRLNEESDKIERACALYQKGLVYAEGLYSKTIDWEIVDKCWGDNDSNLCILQKFEIESKMYIDSKYLNLQFIKYKADHGLLEAKHMYFEICKKEKLYNEDDILVLYMHELCLYSNYDIKYLDEMKEYARRLTVGEGVEKDKKKAAMIKEKIDIYEKDLKGDDGKKKKKA